MTAVPIPILPAIQLKRILYATDFSDASHLALPIVSAISRKYGSQVYVVNVWSQLPYSMVTPEALAIMEHKQEQDAKADMARLLQTSELQELRITPLVTSGDPAEEIRHIVEEHQINLAIIATHGRTGFKRLLMGSLAEELLHSLKCPILIVGPHLDSRFKDLREIRTILFPTDLSPESRAVFPYLASLAADYKATIVALHVARPEKKGGPDERGKEILRGQMKGYFFLQTDPRCHLELIIDEGNPVEKILQHATALGAELIGLGVREAGELMLTHFRQTVTYKVALEAECPVLTFRGFIRSLPMPPDKIQKENAERRDSNWRNFRKDEVGRSGIYPMSGPHPAGDAPLRGQMEWGQAERGASGYEDHGGSELSLDSGVLVGGLDAEWPGATAFERGADGSQIREIPLVEWPAFCDWFSQNFRAMETSIEVCRGREERVAVCRNRPLSAITAHVTAHAVGEISIVTGMVPKASVFDVPGPTRMRMLCNEAGWPTQLEISFESGHVILRFTGEAQSLPIFSKNSWGE